MGAFEEAMKNNTDVFQVEANNLNSILADWNANGVPDLPDVPSDKSIDLSPADPQNVQAQPMSRDERFGIYAADMMRKSPLDQMGIDAGIISENDLILKPQVRSEVEKNPFFNNQPGLYDRPMTKEQAAYENLQQMSPWRRNLSRAAMNASNAITFGYSENVFGPEMQALDRTRQENEVRYHNMQTTGENFDMAGDVIGTAGSFALPMGIAGKAVKGSSTAANTARTALGFGLHEAMQKPEEGETLSDRTVAVLKSTAMGGLVGSMGKLPISGRLPLLGGAFGSTAYIETYAQTGDHDLAMDATVESIVYLAGFEALGLAGKAKNYLKYKLNPARGIIQNGTQVERDRAFREGLHETVSELKEYRAAVKQYGQGSPQAQKLYNAMRQKFAIGDKFVEQQAKNKPVEVVQDGNKAITRPAPTSAKTGPVEKPVPVAVKQQSNNQPVVNKEVDHIPNTGKMVESSNIAQVEDILQTESPEPGGGVTTQAANEADQNTQLDTTAAGLGLEQSAGSFINNEKVTSKETSKGKNISTGDIVRSIKQAIDRPIKGWATHKKPGVAGFYDPQADAIRMKDMGDFPVAAHEAGHFIDRALSGKDKRFSETLPEEARKELKALGRKLYGPKEPHNGYISEGFAEIARHWISDPDQAKKVAPMAYSEWLKVLENDPKLKKSMANVRKQIDRWKTQGAENRIRAQVRLHDAKPPIKKRVKVALDEIERAMVDEMAPLRKLSKQVKDLRPASDPYTIAMIRTDKSHAVAHQFIMEGVTDLAGDTITNEPLSAIIADIDSKQVDNFFNKYMIAKRAALLHSKGKNTGLLSGDIDTVLNKYDTPENQALAKRVTDWNHAVLDYAVEAGAIPEESAKRIKESNPVYIPFQRSFEAGEFLGAITGTGKGIKSVKNAVKKLKGSGREIKDPLQSMAHMTQKLVANAHKAEVTRALVQLANNHKGLAGVWKVPTPKEYTKITVSNIQKQLKRYGLSVKDVFYDEDGALSQEHLDLAVWSAKSKSQFFGKENIVPLHTNGTTAWYELDNDLYKAINGLDKYTLPWWLDFWLGKSNRAVRLGATGINLSFALRNFIRDAGTATMFAEHAKGGPLSAAKGVIDDLTGAEHAKLYKALGGEMTGFIGQDRDMNKKLMSELLHARRSGGKLIVSVKHPVEALRALVGFTETGARLGEFKAAKKYAESIYGKGKDANYYAMIKGADLTVNFSRRGYIGKVLNQIIPFFNANIQGIDKMRRFAQKNPKKIFIRGSIVTAASLALWYSHKDEEWWKDLPTWAKLRGLHIPISDDVILSLPVPFEIGYLFSTLPIVYADSQYHDDPEQFKKAFGTAVESSTPNIIPGAVQPIWDIKTNEDFAGRPIVSEWVRMTKPPAQQYRKSTLAISKAIGKSINMSPADIEHMLNGYSGGLYKRIVRPIEKGITLEEMSNIPVFGTMFVRRPSYPARQIESFYSEMERLKSINEPSREEKVKLKHYETVSRKLSPYRKHLYKTDIPEKQRAQVENAIKKIIETTEKRYKGK